MTTAPPEDDAETRPAIEFDDKGGFKVEIPTPTAELHGHTAQFTGLVYKILLGHVRSKFLDGASLGLAETHHLEAAWRMLNQVEKQITEIPGLVEGMVKYGNQ